MMPYRGEPLEIPPLESAEDFERRVGKTHAPKPAEQSDRGPYALNWHGQRDETPLKEWLVDRTLPKSGKALLSGQWGVYKTFVALALTSSVMTKRTFAGRAVNRQGGVLFIAAEGQDEVRVRLEGIAREAATARPSPAAVPIDPGRMPFTWIEACPRLTSDNAPAELRKIAVAAREGLAERFGLPLALIVIDTLMPAAGFKDANDASETQRVMNVLTDMARAADALVLAVDHFGKDTTTGTRNSSVKEDGADAVLALLADRDLAGKVSRPRLAIRKVRGAPTGEEIPFQMRTVTVFENAGHDAVTTLVVDWGGEAAANAEPAPESKAWTKSLIIFQKALNFALADSGTKLRPFADGPEILAVKRDAVRAEFLKTYAADSPKAKAMAFLRCEKSAVAANLIACRETGPPGNEATFFWRLTPE